MAERKPDCTVSVYLNDDGFAAVVHLPDSSTPISGTFPAGHTYGRLTGRLLGHLLAALRAYEEEMREYGSKNGSV